MAARLGVRHAVAVANGTCALELAYGSVLARRREAGQGDANPGIVMPDMTFVATANAAIAAGGTPVLADCASPDDPRTDADAARALISGAAVAAVCTMHYAGFDALSPDVVEAARTPGCEIIEDAAHAIGGLTADGRCLGAAADIGCFSFFSNKNMATGEGGMVVTNDEDHANWMRLVRSHGMSSPTYDRYMGRAQSYDVLMHGHNFRCSELTAALGLVQLEKLDEATERRRALYARYAANLSDCAARPALAAPDSIARSACHILPLLCPDQLARAAVREALRSAGVETSFHYPPVHSFSAYKGMAGIGSDQAYPNTTAFASREVTLPLHPGLREAEVDEICGIVIATLAGGQPA